MRTFSPPERAFGFGVSLLVSIWLWLAGTSAVARTVPLKDVPFISPTPLHVGETLIYDVRLGAIPAGTQTLRITKDDGVLYQMQSEAVPSALLSKVYHFRDHKVSYVCKEDLLPVRYEKQIEDRSYRGNFVVEFDRERDRATVWRDGHWDQSLDVPEAVQDELSMVYFLRTKELQIGNTYTYTFFTGKKLVPVEIKVLNRVYYKGPEPLGKLPVFRLVASDGFVVWLTADRYRVPVKIEAPLRVRGFGTLEAKLRSYDGVLNGSSTHGPSLPTPGD